jgi:UDP-2-acetamido-3-amino-2,3-dideoxy-glucuronate N-acetyltransferase
LVNNRRLGLAIMIAAPAAIAVYAAGAFFLGAVLVELTVFATLLVVLGVFTWIGYTLFTEPPSPRASVEELDSLAPETINPPLESDPASRKADFSAIVDCEIGEGTIVRNHVNLYKCKIGRNCKVESFVYIEEGVKIGDGCKIKPHVYIPTGVTIEDEVFIGPNVMFTNDKHPHVNGEWNLLRTLVCRRASIGAGSVILPGLRIGRGALIGAGSVVTKDVRDGAVVYGNAARPSSTLVMGLDDAGR